MNARRLLFAVGALLGVVAAAVRMGRGRFARETAAHVDAVLSGPSGDNDPVEPDELANLPDPVRRYLERVLDFDQPPARTARLTQRAEFRLGGPNAPWKSLTANQHVAIDPPGFVWDATIDIAPLLPVRVVDEYVAGTGGLRARFLGAVPVADGPQGPKLDEGELTRYLAEAVWFPTALLPRFGVEWDPVDDSTATATLTHQETTASVDFYFNDRDEVERVHADRYREEDGRCERRPWTGYFDNYQRKDGTRIPTEGKVEWNLPGGDLPYWRGTITEVEYDPVA